MALKIWLKPGEQVMINGAMIENPTDGKIRIQINNQVCMLRQRDYLAESGDLSCAERVYYEAMLLSGGDPKGSLAALSKRIVEYEVPSGTGSESAAVAASALDAIGKLALDHEYYLAMVEARLLIAIENPDHAVLPDKTFDQ